MTSTRLVEALERGKVIGRNHKEEYDSKDYWEFFSMEQTVTGYRHFIRSGWRSALGTIDDRLYDIMIHPNDWVIGKTVKNEKGDIDFIPE